MPVRALQVGFFGNFQCRLATDPAPPTASPAAPGSGAGWTYTWGEVNFDRVIRLAYPVALRDGLLNSWTATRINHVKIDRGSGMTSAPTDFAMGQKVSLGQSVYFDQAAGGGTMVSDAVMDIGLQFGEGPAIFFGIEPKSTPNIAVTVNSSWQAEYQRVKPARAIAHPARSAYMASSGVALYSGFFSFMGSIDGVAMKQPNFFLPTGVMAEAAAQEAASPGTWILHIDWYRFDGDTLVGDVNGWLNASF